MESAYKSRIEQDLLIKSKFSRKNTKSMRLGQIKLTIFISTKFDM